MTDEERLHTDAIETLERCTRERNVLARGRGMNERTALRWPLVRVSWLDSYGPHGWILLRHVLEPSSMDVVSVGWVVQDQADRLTIVAHIQDPSHDSPNVDGCLTIPKVAIKSIMVLQEKSDD